MLFEALTLTWLTVSAVSPEVAALCQKEGLEAEACETLQQALSEIDGYGACQGSLNVGLAKADKYCQLQADYLAYLVKNRVSREGLSRMFEKRRNVVLAAAVKQFKLETAPYKGADKPKVTLVEFFDFQCYACYKMSGVLDALLERYPKDVRLYHKMYPLTSHQNSEVASAAALAAKQKNCYWEMANLLFGVSPAHSEAEIIDYAAKMKLPAKEIKKLMNTASVKAQVAADKAEGQAAGVKGTPSLYINGRYYDLPADIFILSSIVEEIILSTK